MADIKSRRITDEITTLLGSLSSKVELNNSVRLTDINLAAEEFYRKFLNLVYEHSLENINIINGPNSPAIDLGDESAGIAIQVTSDSSSTKAKYTIKKFIEKGLYSKYTTLVILCIAGKQKSYNVAWDTKDHFEFSSKEHIQDCKDLTKKIFSMPTTKQKEVLDFLQSELDTGTRRGTGKQIANEVETLAKLISFLSQNRSINLIKKYVSEPDPEGKVQKRFADYSPFLIMEIKKYIPQYEQARESVQRELQLGPAQFKMIREYLQQQSDAYLYKYNNDPRLALNELTNNIASEIGESGRTYDNAAVRYYLIHELINCNVFPN